MFTPAEHMLENSLYNETHTGKNLYIVYKSDTLACIMWFSSTV